MKEYFLSVSYLDYKANCELIHMFVTRKSEHLFSLQVIQLSPRCRWVTEVLFCVSIPFFVWKQCKSCSIQTSAIRLCLDFCQTDDKGRKETALNEIRYVSFGEHLKFHFYLSIMHEVVEIRPRSARLPDRGTPIKAATLICLLHFHQPCTASLQRQSVLLKMWNCQQRNHAIALLAIKIRQPCQAEIVFE